MTKDAVTLEERLDELREELDRRHLKEMAQLLDALKDKLGPCVTDAVKEYVAVQVRKEWQQIAQREKSHTVDDLMRILWEPLCANKDYKFTLEKQDNGVLLRCTSCPSHKLAVELGITEWAGCLICSGDPYIVEGFNPKMGFKHLKKLMEGDDCCLQHYYMKEYIDAGDVYLTALNSDGFMP